MCIPLDINCRPVYLEYVWQNASKFRLVGSDDRQSVCVLFTSHVYYDCSNLNFTAYYL